MADSGEESFVPTGLAARKAASDCASGEQVAGLRRQLVGARLGGAVTWPEVPASAMESPRVETTTRVGEMAIPVAILTPSTTSEWLPSDVKRTIGERKSPDDASSAAGPFGFASPRATVSVSNKEARAGDIQGESTILVWVSAPSRSPSP